MNTDPNDSGKRDMIRDNQIHYEKGLELAEAGRHWQALEYMQEHLRRTPDDAEVLNDTGAILHCLGRSDEAIDHFVKARRTREDSAEILWNLAEAYLATARASEAVEIFDQMDKMGILNADLLNRTAEIFLNQDNKAGAIETLLRSLRLWSDQEVLRPMIDVIRSKRSTVGFFCEDNGTGAINEIARFVKERFVVGFLESRDDVQELAKWADIAWFEWGSDLAVAVSKQPKTCKSIIGPYCGEGHPEWSQAVNWTNIDVLVAVGESPVEEALMHELSELQGQTSTVVISGDADLRRSAEENYPQRNRLEEINGLLIELEAEIESEEAQRQTNRYGRN